jgi:lysophospholipase L1-like esterase
MEKCSRSIFIIVVVLLQFCLVMPESLVAAKERTHIVIVGDSLLFRPPSDGTQAVKDILYDEASWRLPDRQLVALGFSGAVLTGRADRSAVRIIADSRSFLRGKAVLLFLGGNDILADAFTNASHIADSREMTQSLKVSLTNITTALVAADVRHIGIVTSPEIEQVMAFDNNGFRGRVLESRFKINRDITRIADSLGWTVIDIDLDKKCLRETDRDGMHPNAVGIRCLASAYLKAIVRFARLTDGN